MSALVMPSLGMAQTASPDRSAYILTPEPAPEPRINGARVFGARPGSDFIFAIAVVHMLVLDEDRDGFYRFIRSHLTAEGKALICTMGDGEFEMQSDISTAFTLQERNHDSGKMMVAGTSCRTVSWNTLENELARNGLTIIEKGITSSLPDFNCLMYAVVKA